MIFVFCILEKALYNQNNRGPKTEPWGSLHILTVVLEILSFNMKVTGFQICPLSQEYVRHILSNSNTTLTESLTSWTALLVEFHQYPGVLDDNDKYWIASRRNHKKSHIFTLIIKHNDCIKEQYPTKLDLHNSPLTSSSKRLRVNKHDFIAALGKLQQL